MLIPSSSFLLAQPEETYAITDECLKLKDTYFCLPSHISQDECTNTILQNPYSINCPVRTILVKKPILIQVNNQLIAIPNSTNNLTIKEKCQFDTNTVITNPYVINLPNRCQLQINKDKYILQPTTMVSKTMFLPKIENKLPSQYTQRQN